ncbi:MAG TPA: sigma-E processing peptidase SpoIIGA [Bacillota bacterium]|nr:sigma-E processing peptidase SpoIIGA [Bacillota bacterium]
MVEYRYIDVIWLNNTLVNFLLLYLVWRIEKNTSPIWRLWCSAGIGALYAVLLLVPGYNFLSYLPAKLILSILMVLTAYKICDIRDFLKLSGFFYGITFLLGGAAFGLLYFTGKEVMIDKGIFFIKDFPLRLIIYSAVLIIMLYRLIWPILLRRININSLIYKIELCFDGNSISLDALLDTGNELHDPVSKSPVMVVEYGLIKQILPQDVKHICSRPDKMVFLKDTSYTNRLTSSSWADRFRLIPYYTVSGSGLIVAYRPDKASILIDGRWAVIKDVIVGIRNEKLTSDNEYNALIQPQILP